MTAPIDVLVIGAGQAGLAAGYWLRQSGLAFVLVDGAERIGHSWRSRWDSLTLFTPARYSALPGMAITGDPDRLPTKDEIADYLEIYARYFELPLRLGDAVVRLERADDAQGFVANLASGVKVGARSVIVATGAFQMPALPDIARDVGSGVVQLALNTYRNPAALPGGAVLVVGDGATGRQIALELAATHRVLLSTGRPRRVIPERVLGRSTFWWLDRLGLARAGRDSMVGRFLRGRDPFPGRRLGLGRLRAAGVVTKARLASMEGNLATFGDGSAEMIAAVVWATGYHDDTSWIVADGALDGQGQVIESEGVSPVEGLYYIGRSWQRNRGSALLRGVGEDARLIVDHVSASLARRPAGKTLSSAAVGSGGTGPPRRRVNYSLG